jgi:hypothetical protein
VTPFVHFRSWLRAAPLGERVLSAVAGLALLCLFVWASTPFPASSGSAVLTGAGASSAPVSSSSTTGSGPAARVPGASAGPQSRSAGSSLLGVTTTGAPSGLPGAGGTTASGRSAPRRGCGSPGATDQGVTARTITIGIVVVDLGAASNALKLPSAADQRKAHTAVFSDINAKGGVLCRKLVPKFYTDSTLDASSEHSLCLQMAQDRLFAVYNNLFNTSEQTCIAKQHIPNIWYTPPHTPDVKQYAPYILSWQADFDHLIHQYIAGASSLGYFTGMKKLGILEGSCYPDENAALVKELRAVGIDPDKASTFNYGCPANSAAPAPQADQQAALQFKRDGVTHVVNVAYGNDVYVANAADQQGYHPKFAKMEDASAGGLESASQKPPKSWDGTLLITSIQTGAPHTPHYVFNKATQACTQLLAGQGLPSAYSPGLNSLLGIACVDGALFSAMAERAPSLTRTALADGLARVGHLDLAYPAGPVDISDAGLPTGGQLARPGVWVSACECWHLTDVRWRAY